jgi:hypothetical protein
MATFSGQSLFTAFFPATDAEHTALGYPAPGDPPAILFVPADGSSVTRLDPVTVDVTSSDAITFLFVLVEYIPASAWEAVHDGTEFTPLYAGSTLSVIPGGVRLVLVRGGGWTRPFRVRVYATGSGGGAADSFASYDVIGLSTAVDLNAAEDDTCAPRELSHNTGHVVEGIARLIEQYKGKPRMEAWLSSYLKQVQEAEDACWQLLTERNVDTAIGSQQDVLGKLLGRPRRGLADPEYKTVLRAQTLVNRSQGTPDDLIGVLAIMAEDAGETAVITITENFPAAITVTLASDIGSVDPDLVFEMLNLARGQGIWLNFVFTYSPIATAFIFGGTATGDDASTTQGFGNTEVPGNGGKMASVRGP